MGATLITGSAAESKYVGEETEKWAKVVKFLGREAGVIRKVRGGLVRPPSCD